MLRRTNLSPPPHGSAARLNKPGYGAPGVVGIGVLVSCLPGSLGTHRVSNRCTTDVHAKPCRLGAKHSQASKFLPSSPLLCSFAQASH